MINFKKGKEHVCRGIPEFLYSRFRKEEIGAAELDFIAGTTKTYL